MGDIEGMPFIEAFRQFQFRVGRDNFCVVHVSLVPEVGKVLLSPTEFFLLQTGYHTFFIISFAQLTRSPKIPNCEI